VCVSGMSEGFQHLRRDSLDCRDSLDWDQTEPLSPPITPSSDVQEACAGWFRNLRLMCREERQSELLRLFNISDHDGTSKVKLSEMEALIRTTGLQLTDERITQLGLAADQNADGMIDEDEFMDTMLDLIHRDSFSQTFVDLCEIPSDKMNWYFHRLFQLADANNDGVLSMCEFAKMLDAARLNLSAAEILRILHDADTNADNLIDYKEFVPSIQGIVEDLRLKRARGAFATSSPQFSRHSSWRGESGTDLQEKLCALFKSGDTDDDGVLSATEFSELLNRSDLGFEPEVVLQLLLKADTNESGGIDYREFLGFRSTCPW